MTSKKPRVLTGFGLIQALNILALTVLVVSGLPYSREFLENKPF